MKLQLLGPVDLVVGQRRIDIGAPRFRVVLAMLALNVNRVTPVDQLVDAMWDDSPPYTARNQIQICVSALRKLFADAGHPNVIKTRAPGYLLELGADELDSVRFTSLVTAAKAHSEAGRNAEAAVELRESLALWRGPALADVQSDLVQRGAAYLDEMRLTALEERIRLDLTLGRHRQIIGELRALCAEHPLREQLYGFLMRALYRSGRQAEALNVSRQARTILVEQIGVEPGQGLRDIERSILNRGPELEWSADQLPTPREPLDVVAVPEAEATDAPRQLPASFGDFTGRKAEIARIERLLAETGDRYAMRIVAISGKGGVGKSSLAIRAAHTLADAFPDGHLYGDLQMGVGENVAFRLLGRFLLALGVNGASIPDELAERAEMYRSRLAGKRLLVVLDDIADEEQVLPLLPGSPTCAVILTSRARLTGLPGGHGVNIGAFDVGQSVELLTKIVGADRVHAEPETATMLVNLCGGLPLALRIAGARLASRPHWRIGDLVQRMADEGRRLDEFAHHGLALRSAIDLTYESLDKEAVRLFRLFSLMQGPDFPGWTAAALLGTSVLDAEEVLERLVDAQVLDTVEAPGTGRRYRFHDLIRVYANERVMQVETEQQRHAALTRLMSTWLGLAEQAHRKEYGGDFTVLHGSAARWYPPGAGEIPVESSSAWWGRERRTLVAVTKQAAKYGFDELCWDLVLTSVSMFESGCHFDDWRETTELGLRAAEAAGNRRGTAAMLYSLGSLDMVQQRVNAAQHHLSQALELFELEEDDHGRALVLRNSAYLSGVRGNHGAMCDQYRRSLALMRQVGDRVGEAHVLRATAKHAIESGDTDTARERLHRALTICREVRSRRCEAQVMHRFAELYLTVDDIEAARNALHEVLLIVRDMGDRIGEVYALYGLGVVRFREGRLDSAGTTLVHALELAKQVGERLVEGETEYVLGDVAIARDEPAAAISHLINALMIFEELGSTRWRAKVLTSLSKVHAMAGEVELDRVELDRG